jgi:hypothetical protein
MNIRVKTILLVILVQLLFLAILFGGVLIDPLIGVYMIGFYFAVIGSFLLYYFIRSKL